MKRRALLLLLLLCLFAGLSFGKNPYKVLGVGEQASAADIKRAYKKLAVQYHPDKIPSGKASSKFLDIQEAYGILNDPEKRREFDLGESTPSRGFFEEQTRGGRQAQWQGHWTSWFGDPIASTTPVLDRRQFMSQVLQSEAAWVVQVYADSHMACRFAAPHWDRVAKENKAHAKFGRVNFVADPSLTAQIAATGSLLNLFGALSTEDLPMVIGYPPSCTDFSCGKRYSGPLDSDAIAAFIAESLLFLPQIPAVTRANINSFLGAVNSGKVVMLVFSSQAQASLKIRNAVAEYKDFIKTGRVHIKTSEDKDFWSEEYNIQRGPAVLFFLGPGTDPIAYSGTSLNVKELMSRHLWAAVPQLNSETAGKLGCAWGEGVRIDQQIQACAVLVGRKGKGMKAQREILAKLASRLQSSASLQKSASAASKAYRSSNLRILWIDAGRQYEFCKYHISTLGVETVRAVCGRRQHWLSFWRVWERWEEKEFRLIVYKPGAVKLNHWTLPHRFSTFDGSIDRTSIEALAAWLSFFLGNGNSKQHTIYEESEAPVQLHRSSLLASDLYYNIQNRIEMLRSRRLDLYWNVWTFLSSTYRADFSIVMASGCIALSTSFDLTCEYLEMASGIAAPHIWPGDDAGAILSIWSP